MFNYVINFIENNFMIVIMLATLFISFGLYFKCLKKLLLISGFLLAIYILISQLTHRGIINDKLYNLLAYIVYNILIYIESYSNYYFTIKEFPLIRMFELCQMLLMSSLLVLILNLTNFYKVVVMVRQSPNQYLKKIEKLFDRIDDKIFERDIASQTNIFNKIILNC